MAGKTGSFFAVGAGRLVSMLQATMNFDPRPVVLEGAHVRLEPLATGHAQALFSAGRDPEIWRYMLTRPFERPADAEAWVAEALRMQDGGGEVPFVIVSKATGSLAGTTRYLDVRRPHRTLEIGWTWLAAGARPTAIYTECKYLLLRHAFEKLGAVRVQLKTDVRNERSRKAIARLGAVEEGVLRKYQTRFDGYVRDTVMFSIIETEWPGVKQRLEGMMAR